MTSPVAGRSDVVKHSKIDTANWIDEQPKIGVLSACRANGT
jgi:hypothetical protein